VRWKLLFSAHFGSEIEGKMTGVLRNLNLQVWEGWCEGCEGFLFKTPGKARVRARVSNAFRQTMFGGESS
jgi:hypothetical protein